MSGTPLAAARMAEVPPSTLAMSTSPAAIAWVCWAPEVITGLSTLTPKGANASSRKPFSRITIEGTLKGRSHR